MTLLNALRDQLAGAESLLAGLGPRPKGNPDEIMAAAGTVATEAAATAALARLVAAIPSRIRFVAPAAVELSAYTNSIAASLIAKSRMLTMLSDELRRRARELHRDQIAHDASRKRIGDAVAALTGQIASMR